MAHVLLIDDDPANLMLLRAILSQDGYELTCASDGASALSLIARHIPDLVLLDRVMPGIDGLALLERLKADPVTAMVPTVMVTGSSERAERLRAIELGVDELLTKPVDRIELRTRVRALLRLKHHLDQLERSENVLLTMARAVEARDPDLREHCDRMTRLATCVAQEFGTGRDDLRTLRLAAGLHDIGKIGLPDTILLKAGPLDASERSLMQTHPVVGESILRPLSSVSAVLPLVRHHHERLDGSGYPDGLHGEEIPLLVRILSVIDVFDALTTNRPYRAAMHNDRAFDILSEEIHRGWWDPDVVRCLDRVVRQ